MHVASGHEHSWFCCRVRGALLGLVVSLVFGTITTSARAHPALDAAIVHAEDAEFDEALARFDEALDSGELTKDDLILLLRQRALVFHALGRDGALSRDLSLLAMLAPDRDLGRAAPPPLVSRWNELRATQAAPVSIHGACGPSATGTQISTQVEGLRAPELGQVFIHVRDGRAEDGQWVQKQAGEVDMPSGAYEYFVEIRGLGGISLAEDGNSTSPLACIDFRDDAAGVVPATTNRDSGKNRKMWWWIGTTGVVVVAAVVTTVVVLNTQGGSETDRTTVSKPMVSF